ncbi:uncharacterized protein LOC124809141 isoform X1 [Hydra vulgaris]|uniref:NADH dehydrogenase [ubiquinone] 1 beta subcomplex subunit 9 n=1 Tax=Hydra vulgaris TaxID=6087 RepID=T2M2G5_HYDVU|nr:NADH dehydrogenase [ubiquinone] 1 beta subcomplex subunit 9-like isoform X1 [Hydra vulgaris]
MANTNPVILAQRLQLSHKQRVLKLYRDSLKHLLSWTGSRLIWREQAVLLRERFDANKHLTDRSQIQKVLEEGEKLFNENRHPQPYIFPSAPYGSKWERNIPPPPSVLEMLPEEEEWYNDMTKWANGKE